MYVLCKCILGSILGFINVSIKLFVYIFGGAQCPRLHLQIDTKLGRDLPRHRLQPRPGLPHRGLDLVLGTASQFYIRNIRRRPLFVPSPCVQCRYLRLSCVGSGLNVCYEILLLQSQSLFILISYTLIGEVQAVTTNIDPPYP